MSCSCSSGAVQLLKLEDVKQLDEVTYSFELVSNEPMNWQEGDSSKLYINIDGQYEERKFSIASISNEGKVQLVTRIRNRRSLYKDRMLKVRKGELLNMTEPKGNFGLRRNGRPALLLSNGVGVATMRSLIKAFDENINGVNKLIQINVDSSSSLFKNEFDDLAENSMHFDSVYTDHREDFYKALDFQSQKLMFQTGILPNMYICGSDDFVIDVSSYLQSIGHHQDSIITDGININSMNARGGCGSGCGCSCG